jgi:uncharacterized protein (TIGR02452 family)
MGRNQRAELARTTLAAVEAGAYTGTDGVTRTFARELSACLAGTELWEPEVLARAVVAGRERPAAHTARIEVHNETTLAGIARLESQGERNVTALNFASARVPGGGFLGGSQAQEESLARSSALYASLMTKFDYYERHRQATSLLYSDAMIWSPGCPVLRDDDGAWLAEPRFVNFITAAAPNAGAVLQNQPEEAPRIPAALTQRAECVLALAAQKGCETLVLGAWGCGVFRNDPVLVANVFRELLCGSAQWLRHFRQVRFSVFDAGVEAPTYEAFRRAFAAH